MTQEHWLECADPWRMIAYAAGRTTARKLRLFACACCRRIMPLLVSDEARQELDDAERFADRLANDEARSAARKLAQRTAQVRGAAARPTAAKWERRAASAVYYAAARVARDAANGSSNLAIEGLIWRAGGHGESGVAAIVATEKAAQAALLREMIPYRERPPLSGCITADVARLGTAAYAGDWGGLPVLADALEEAGCADDTLLSHLRSPGPHVRGCWALDLVLGRS